MPDPPAVGPAEKPRWKRRLPWIVTAVLVLFAAVLRGIPFNPRLAEGSSWYWFIGAKIATGDLGAVFTYDEGVFYVLLLAIVELLTGPQNIFAAKMVTFLASVTSVGLTYLLGREVASDRAGFFSALLLAWSLLDIRFSSTIQYNLPYVALFLGTLYAAAVGYRRGSRIAFRTAGILTICTILTRVTGLLLPISLAPTFWRLRRRARHAAPSGGPDADLDRRRLAGIRSYFRLAGLGTLLFVLLSIPVFHAPEEYIRYRQINQASLWTGLARGDFTPLVSVVREVGLNQMIALLNLDAPYSIQTNFFYRTIDFNAFAQSTFAQLAVLVLVLVSARFVRFRPVFLFFALHTTAFAFYEADLRYTLFGLALTQIFLYHGLEAICERILRVRAAARTLVGALFLFLVAARAGAYQDYLRYVKETAFFEDKYDQLSMYGYVLADRWLARQTDLPEEPRILYPVLMVDFCTIAETPGRIFDTDYTVRQTPEQLTHRIRETAATHLVFQEIDGFEEYDSILLAYLERVPFEEKLVYSAQVHLFYSDLLRGPDGHVGPRTLTIEGDPVHIRPIHRVVNHNRFFDLDERIVICRVEQPRSEPDPDIACIYDCCFEYQLP